MPDGDVRRLALVIGSVAGIEPLVWLTDIGGLSRRDAADVMLRSAQAVLGAALDELSSR